MRLPFIPRPQMKEAQKILSIVGDVLYDFGLYSDKVTVFGRYQFPLRLAGPPILVGGYLKIPVDTSLLPKAVFRQDLEDERLLTALRVATGCHVETRSGGSLQLPNLLFEKSRSPGRGFMGFGGGSSGFDFWYVVEMDQARLRGIPRNISYDRLPNPSSLSFSTLPVPFGYSVGDKFQHFDLSSVIGLLVAGSTRSGKSVFLRQMLTYLAKYFSPAQFQAILGDFKFGVEFGVFNTPEFASWFSVVGSAGELLSRVERATIDRFDLFRLAGCRDILSYNASGRPALPYVLVVIDEYASFRRLLTKDELQKAELMVSQSAGAGLYWVVSTQRPTTDVITGTFKAQLGARVSFSLASLIDSEVVFDREVPDVVRIGCKGRAFAEIEDHFFEFQSSYVV